MLCEKYSQELSDASPSDICDCRPMWALVFRHNWSNLQQLVGFYLSLDCGSCELERNLSQVQRLSKSHGITDNAEDVERALELLLDGAKQESELFERKVLQTSPVAMDLPLLIAPAKPQLFLTDASRELCRLWIQFYGRRFHLYKKRSDCGKVKGHRPGSEACVLSQQIRARNKICAGEGVDRELLSRPRVKFAAKPGKKLEDSELWNKQMQKFSERSAEIKKHHLGVTRRSGQGREAYPPGQLLF